MKKFECSQKTTGFLFCTYESGNCIGANGHYHKYYGFGMYLYYYMGMGRGYGTINFRWDKGGQVNVVFEEYPHHLIIL